MDYQRDAEGHVVAQQRIGDHWVRFLAQSVRLERGIQYAHLTLVHDQMILDEDEVKLGRREDRNRLANSAWQAMPETTRKGYPKEQMQHDVLIFCRGLWDYVQAQEEPEWRTGADSTPPEFLLRPYVVSGGGTILFAPPKRGKSYTGLLWAFSVQYGLRDLWQTRQASTLFVNLERSPESIDWRIGRVAQAVGLDEKETPLYVMNRRGAALADIIHALRFAVARNGIELVIVDSLSRMGVGDMTENRPANQAMDMLNSLSCAWVALAHTPRGDESHVYGSQMFDAAADVLVEMATERHPDRTGIGLRVVAGNDVPETEREYLAYEFVPDGLVAMRPAEAQEFPELAADQRGVSVVDQIVSHLMATGEDNGKAIALAVGRDPSNVHKILTNHPHLFHGERQGRAVMWSLAD